MSNPFDDDEPIKSYTKKAKSNEDEVEDYEREIERLMQETLSSTQRSGQHLESAEKHGTDTARNLLEQREKLERTEKNLDEINYTTQQTQRSLNSLKSVFGGFFKNKFSRAPQKPQNEVSSSASTNRLNQTIENNSIPSMTSSKSASFEPTLSADARRNIQGTRWGAMDDEIDENLGNMGNQLARLRALGTALGEEVNDQNQMLDRIQVKAERNDAVVRNQDNQMKKLLGYKPAAAEIAKK